MSRIEVIANLLNLNLSSVFTEGKYEGITFEEAYSKDPGYISWLILKKLDTPNQEVKYNGNHGTSLYADDLEEYYNSDNIDPSNPLDFYENDFISY